MALLGLEPRFNEDRQWVAQDEDEHDEVPLIADTATRILAPSSVESRTT
jgi:hypothetical protein